MNDKYSCVIDASGQYQTFVVQFSRPQTDGAEEWEVQYYTLKDDERLVDSERPPDMRTHAGTAGFVRPRWDDKTFTWVEGATAEEITAWEAAHPAPAPIGPSAQEDADALLVDLEYRTILLELGVN